MKRVYFTLALMSLFGGLNAFADGVKQNGVVYDKMSDGRCFVVNYDEATMPEDGKVTIAATVIIDGVDYPVLGILGSGDYSDYNNGKTGEDNRGAFTNCTKITGLRFADNSGVTFIGDHAFKNCSNLETIENIPSTLKNIERWCFEGTALKSVDLSNTQITTMTDGVFFINTSLTSIKLPNKLENFWDNAFNGCTSLNNIEMPSTVKGIYNNVFYGCKQLSDVKLPMGLTYIGKNAFCKSSIASITFPPSLQKIDDYAFQYAKLANVVIPTSCNTIGQAAFANNNNLTTVVINGTKCYLAYEAFANCTYLTDVYITSNIQPTAERYGFPFTNNPKVHVMKDYVDVFSELRTDQNLNPCNTVNFDSNFSIPLSKKWTTFTSAYNLDFSSVKGLTAYTAKYDEANDAVALTPVMKVQASTGLILKGEAGITYTLPILASNEAELDAVPDNSQLIGCVDALWSTGRETDYYLHDGKFVKSTYDGWVLPGKSYLYIEGGRANNSESPLRVYVDNTATSIDGITNNPVVKDEAYYNLQGVKVQRPQHGVFIHNGKKVVLK